MPVFELTKTFLLADGLEQKKNHLRNQQFSQNPET